MFTESPKRSGGKLTKADIHIFHVGDVLPSGLPKNSQPSGWLFFVIWMGKNLCGFDRIYNQIGGADTLKGMAALTPQSGSAILPSGLPFYKNERWDTALICVTLVTRVTL